jgi:RNA polymerase sigma-70 factor (ECF subfamily)
MEGRLVDGNGTIREVGVPDGPLAVGHSDSPVCSPPGQPPKSRVDHASEAAALACVRRGERDQALKILMVAYGASLTAFVVRVLRDRELAKDVRQQVFLDAFQGLEKFEGRSSLWSWLCSIAYHRCFDELKRVQRARAADELDVRDGLAEPPDAAMDPDRVEKRRALDHCLGKLSAAMRAQLLMRYLLGLSYAEIGEVIGVPHSTVQVRISRILPKLRQCLRGEGVAR